MSDLNNDLRLVIDTGKVSFGGRDVARAIGGAEAKTVIVANKGKKTLVDDLLHMCKVGGIRVIQFNGNSVDLGTVCGKPYAVNALAVLESGNSGILNNEY